MSDLNARKEDFGILLGIDHVDSALDTAMQTVWVPYWKNLPAALRTPRRLIENKDLVYTMLEAVGSRLVSERIDLEDQVKGLRSDIASQRNVFLRDLATTAEFSASCQAFNVSYSPDDTDPDEPFSGDDDTLFDAEDLPDPMWKVCITFVGPRATKRVTNILTHQEFIMFFAGVSDVVTKDPDPDYTTELDDALNQFGMSEDDSLFSQRAD
jgi:hypothetical protein